MPRHPTKIVSSEHLVSETSAELSEFEYGLIMAGNAFNRWMVRCMSAASAKVGKEVFFSATPAGRELCGKYREVRESCLISALKESGLSNEQIGEAAQLLRNASGLYDTAARAAASL